MMREQRREGGDLRIICAVSSKAHISWCTPAFGKRARHGTAHLLFRSCLAHLPFTMIFRAEGHHIDVHQRCFGVKWWIGVLRRKKVEKKRRVYICRAQGASLTCSSPEPREILEDGLSTIS